MRSAFNCPALCRCFYLLLIFLFARSFQETAAQIISSEKATIKINNLSEKQKRLPGDTLPPNLIIVSPELSKGLKIVNHHEELEIIGKATDNSGNPAVFINTQNVNLSDEGAFVYKLKLFPGENIVSVVAMDQSNNLVRRDFIIDFTDEPLAVIQDGLLGGTNYALLIGIDKYDDPDLYDLDNPIQDAKSLYNVLINDYMFDQKDVFMLKNATRIDIINALDDLSEKISSDDNLLIFYAGHGWWDENAKIGYWLPSDAEKNSKAAWFRNSTLCDYLKEIRSKHTLLIADACFAGGIFKTRKAFADAPVAINKLYELPSRKAMTSGTLTEVPDHSAFVEYLVDRLEENKEKYLSSEQLFSSFRIAVINNSDAIPQYGEIKGVGDEGGDYIFIRKEK